MINLLEEKDIQKIDGLLEFALNDNIIGLASKYLNTIPSLLIFIYSIPSQIIQLNQANFFIATQRMTVSLNFFLFR